MKVALLGAPGAGKTELAKRLVRNLNRDGKGKWVVIDGYVERLAERTGCEYGDKAWYTHNTQVMCERWTLEAEALHKGYSTITCGSIYETIIYAAMINIVPPADEQGLLRFQYEGQTAMQFFGFMEGAVFNYNALFYLPYPPHTHTIDWSRVVNAKLPELLDGYGRYAITLDEPTLRAKTKHALEVIRSARTIVAEDVEQAV